MTLKIIMGGLCLMHSVSTFAMPANVTQFYQLFKSGDYDKALVEIEKIKIDDRSIGFKFYLKGITYSKVQEYEKAKKAFEEALKYKIDLEEESFPKDFFYEYGQALYANNNLKEARKAFKRSVYIKFNRIQSLYYVGNISQILEEYVDATTTFIELIKEKDLDTKMAQVGRLQLAESALQILRTNTKLSKEQLIKEVDTRIIPVLQKAYDLDTKSSVASDIEKRRKEILKEFDIDPDVLVNGRRISSKRTSGYLSVKNKYDNNVTNTNLQNNTTATQYTSAFQDLALDLKYDLVIKRKITISPEIRSTFTQYDNNSDSPVYQNNSMSHNPSIKNKFEHSMFNNPASVLFDLDYSKNYKDYDKTKMRKSYAKSLSYSFGEQFTYFKIGDSTLNIKYKNYKAYTPDLDNHTYSLVFNQTCIFSNQHMLIGLFEADYIKNTNASSTNTNSYLIRFDYIVPEILPKFMLTTSLSSTIIDTLEQSNTRGTELTLTPGLELTRDINNHWKAILNYEYTSNSSKSDTYKYTKSVYGIEIKYIF